MSEEIELAKKMMVVPESAYNALIYFSENDKLEAVGVLRNIWDNEHNHAFATFLELPEFAEIYSPLKSTHINNFIHNFLRSHHKSCEGKLIKITIEILKGGE